jgi:hypothetical protein
VSASFSACALIKQTGNAGSQATMAATRATGAGWWLRSYYGANRSCEFIVSDGTNTVDLTGSLVADGWHLCCGSLTHGGAATSYIDGAQNATGSGAAVGSLTNTNGLWIGATDSGGSNAYNGSIAGVWYWTSVVTITQFAALYAKATTTGLGTDMAGLAPNPAFVWLASRPLANSANSTVAATYNTTIRPGLRQCGSAQNTANCLPSVVFSAAGTAQYFDCGATAGDPGDGTTSPTYDFSACAVFRSESSTYNPVVTKKGADDTGWVIEPQGYAGTPPYSCAFITSGVNGGTGALSSENAWGQWTVCCGSYTANDGTTNGRSCPYESGALGTTPDGYHVCDNWPSQSLHTTTHLFIGSTYNQTPTFFGDIVEVLFFNSKLTAAQFAAYAAPWLDPNPSNAPSTKLVGGETETFASGM